MDRVVAVVAMVIIAVCCLVSVRARLRDATIDTYERVMVVGALSGISLFSVVAAIVIWGTK